MGGGTYPPLQSTSPAGQTPPPGLQVFPFCFVLSVSVVVLSEG